MKITANLPIFKKIGKGYVYYDTSLLYIRLVQIAFVAITFFVVTDLAWYWIVAIFYYGAWTLFGLVFIHVNFFMPNIFKYTSLRNPTTVQMLKNTQGDKENLVDKDLKVGLELKGEH